jgi:soluble lytic murein transglycosylase-like protein
MKSLFGCVGLVLASATLGGCNASTSLPEVMSVTPSPRPASARSELDGMIARYAAQYDVPVSLVHHVVKRESNYNPKAYNAGNWGLMQIRYATARTMGYRGEPEGLLDAETNLKYAVKYLRGAYIVAGGDENRADRLYRTGYYYHAKRAGLLEETGLRPAKSKPAETAVAKAEGGETVTAIETTGKSAEARAEDVQPAAMAYSGPTPSERPSPPFPQGR